MTNSAKQLVSVNLFCAVTITIISVIIFCIKTPSIKPEDINDHLSSTSEDSVSYEDYKTFEKVAKKLNIKYEFASKEDEEKFAERNLKEEQNDDNQQNKPSKQLSIILLINLVFLLITNCIFISRDE